MAVLGAIAQSPPSASRMVNQHLRNGPDSIRIASSTALDKMQMAKWITAYSEDAPEDSEPRRFYQLDRGWAATLRRGGPG